MLHLAQGFQGAAEEGGLPSTGGGKKVTPVMPDSKESGHEDGSPGRKSEVIRRILQQKKVGTDILVEGQKLFNKLEAKFSDANISAASFRQLVDKCAGIEMILVNEMLKEVGIELDDRLHMNKLISGALAEARDNEEREERERKVYASKIGIMVDHDDEHAEVEGKLERALAIRSFCHQVPFFNILYVFLFDGAPDEDEVREILNTMILLSALIVTVVVTFVTSFEVDEITKWKQNFDANGLMECLQLNSKHDEGFFEEWYEYFVRDTSSAIACSSASCLSLVMFYMVSTNLNFNVEDNEGVYHVWWRYARWIVGCALIGLCFAILFMFYSIIDLYVIKFPDYYVSSTCESEYQEWDYVEQSTWGYALSHLKVILFLGLSLTMMLLSLGIRAKYRREENLPDWPCVAGRWHMLKHEGWKAVKEDAKKRGWCGTGWTDSQTFRAEMEDKKSAVARDYSHVKQKASRRESTRILAGKGPRRASQ